MNDTPEGEPKKEDAPPGNPHGADEFLKANLMDNALALRESGEVDLEAKGRILELAVQREDWPKVKEITKDLAKLAKEAKLAETAEYFDYISSSIKGSE